MHVCTVVFETSLTVSVLYTSEELDLRSRVIYVLALGSLFYRERGRIYTYLYTYKEKIIIYIDFFLCVVH